MRMGGFSWLIPRRLPRVSPLTLSSPTKASLIGIILWRCWARAEHGIAHPKPRALRRQSISKHPDWAAKQTRATCRHYSGPKNTLWEGVIRRVGGSTELFAQHSVAKGDT